MDCPFVVGQKVVCIVTPDQWNRLDGESMTYPEKGEPYTVRELELGRGPFGSLVFIRLREIQNGVLANGHEPSFHAVGFRPLTEGERDLYRSLDVKPDRLAREETWYKAKEWLAERLEEHPAG